MNELLNKEITVIVEGLNKPCGGILVSYDDRFLIMETNTGNTLRVPVTRICSILTRTNGGTNDTQR